ncbi:transporter [Rubellicoccus peritrichatus]|uniref:Transporter n=1 Tax=Rubellicoccus peritrichatus TaxID=3080537 RepID=A0AAQ3L9F4_9BACT|nr:transporter [Puniceicoccus sp. CR14]WOO39745.1 transporter [Puniceicoccus sp. CR14]
MKQLFSSLTALLLASSSLFAVYAPIPIQEQGKALTFSIDAGGYYDSNIFGSETTPVQSYVAEINGRLTANYSLTDQTFLSAYYDLEYLYLENRPGDKNLFNNRLGASVDHTFSPTMFLSVSDDFSLIQNPDSAIIASAPLQTDQSYLGNVFDIAFTMQVLEKLALVNKYRNYYINYDDSNLAQQLDRMEHLYGLELDYQYLPEWTIVGEYRFKYNDYRNNAPPKNSASNFLLAGFDYQFLEQLTLLARVGVDFRDRDSAPEETSPYGELTAVYQLGERSFVSGAFTYGIFETSDTTQFLDSEDAIFIVNSEVFVTDFIALSGSVLFQYSQLQGRGGIPDADERTVRTGLGVSYLPTPNWAVIANYDYDFINSDVPGRSQVRNRIGLSGRYTF